jgi:CRP-like cAMP-binding protein
MTLDERLATLGMVPEFRQLPGPERTALASAMREEVYGSGEVVCAEGEVGDRIFVVHSGRLSVTQAGRDEVLQQLSRGAMLGEVAFFEGGLRTATVTATTPCSILSLEFERLRKFLLANPDSALIIAARLARMLRNAETMLVELERGRRTG